MKGMVINMKKKNIIFIILFVIIIISFLLFTMYLIDKERMRNNQPVIFSTWGYSYTHPLESAPTNNTETNNNLIYVDDENSVSLNIPNNWNYEKVTPKMGKRLWETIIYPNELTKENYFSIHKAPNFGVCGTGLEVKHATLNNNSTAEVGYYDGSSDWNYIVLNNDNDIIAINYGLKDDLAKQALEILKTIKF